MPAIPAIKKEVLHQVDLTLAPGTITCVIGESGSGKSTLLQAVLQLPGKVDFAFQLAFGQAFEKTIDIVGGVFIETKHQKVRHRTAEPHPGKQQHQYADDSGG